MFYELIRFNAPRSRRRASSGARRQLDALAPTERCARRASRAHAPYSVAPLVFRAIREATRRAIRSRRAASTWRESAEEVEFIRTGRARGARCSRSSAPGIRRGWRQAADPVEYLDDSGFSDRALLAVHGVQMSHGRSRRLAARGTTLVTCPRSNGHTGAGAPPIEDFYDSGVHVAVGTDSLASAPDLNRVRRARDDARAGADGVRPRRCSTAPRGQGARALGFDADFGTIEPGKRARLLAVDLPPGIDDVEEYLVGGHRSPRADALDSMIAMTC